MENKLFMLETDKVDRSFFGNKMLHPWIISFNPTTHLVSLFRNASTSANIFFQNAYGIERIPFYEFQPVETNTTFIIILRDPIERFKSAIARPSETGIVRSLREEEVSYLLVNDSHFMPQINFIPMDIETKKRIHSSLLKKQRKTKYWSKYASGKTIYEEMQKSKNKYVFFKLKRNNDVVSDIVNFLNGTDTQKAAAKKLKNYNASTPNKDFNSLDPTLKKMIFDYYEQDLEFYNNVSFYND